jgi:hypothetical protein
MPITIAESIRTSLHAVVSQRTYEDSASQPIQETTLVRNGLYCGRRFQLMGFSLIWFQEEGQIKLFGPHGGLELSCSVAQFCSQSQTQGGDLRRAA